MTQDVVLLVPGFLGFSRVGNFYYFAERVLAVIRGSLEARLGYRVPVVPCSTLRPPAHPLRRDDLGAALRDLSRQQPALRAYSRIPSRT